METWAVVLVSVLCSLVVFGGAFLFHSWVSGMRSDIRALGSDLIGIRNYAVDLDKKYLTAFDQLDRRIRMMSQESSPPIAWQPDSPQAQRIQQAIQTAVEHEVTRRQEGNPLLHNLADAISGTFNATTGDCVPVNGGAKA